MKKCDRKKKQLTNKKCKQKQLQHQHRRYYRLQIHIFVVVAVGSVDLFFSLRFFLYLEAHKQTRKKTNVFLLFCVLRMFSISLSVLEWLKWHSMSIQFGWFFHFFFFIFFPFYVETRIYISLSTFFFYFSWFRALFSVQFSTYWPCANVWTQKEKKIRSIDINWIWFRTGIMLVSLFSFSSLK